MLTPAGALRLGIQQQPRSQQLAPLSVHGGGFGTPSTALAPRPQAGVSAMTEAERRLDLMCAKSDMAMAEEEREARALRERVAALRVERTAAVEECKRMRAALNAAAVGLESVRAEAAAKDEALVQRKVRARERAALRCATLRDALTRRKRRPTRARALPPTCRLPPGAAGGIDGAAPDAAGAGRGDYEAHARAEVRAQARRGAARASIVSALARARAHVTSLAASSQALDRRDAYVRCAGRTAAATSSWFAW
jgi:hypothetical protein